MAINIKFPINDDNIKGRFFETNRTTKNALVSNLTLLLTTNKGERYMYPNYGTNLLKFVFEPNDSLTITDVEEDLRKTVKEFIPQLTIDKIQFFNESEDSDGDPVGDNELKILINFTYKDNVFSEQGTLALTI